MSWHVTAKSRLEVFPLGVDVATGQGQITLPYLGRASGRTGEQGLPERSGKQG